MNLAVRTEVETDQATVHQIHSAAFPTDAEARLVDLLRDQASPVISLVAEKDKIVCGHLMLSPATLDSAPDLPIMGLAPMAVLPGLQRQGIGSLLVEAGLQHCQENQVGAVVVLGHPAYYPRFGFLPAQHYRLSCHYEVPAEGFMVRELMPGYLEGQQGPVSYHPVFSCL